MKSYIHAKIKAQTEERQAQARYRDMSVREKEYTIRGTNFKGTMGQALERYGPAFLMVNPLIPTRN